MENQYFIACLPTELDGNQYSFSKGILCSPPTLLNYRINCVHKRNSKEPSIPLPAEKCPTTNRQLTQHELILLQARKNNLIDECAQLEKQIQEKRESLGELKTLLSSSTIEFQSSAASKLAAGLAHEIRNPLTTVKGFIQLLKPDLQAIGKEEFTDVVLEEINRANDLLSEFLTLLKPAPTGKRKVSVNNVINSMEKLFTSEAILQNIQFSANVPVSEFYVFGNEKQLKQVFMNLLKNAFEAVEGNDRKKNGVISISLHSINSHAEISIQDNGSGIEEHEMKKMFTPFYTTKERGTGIGLVICKQIIEDHDGSLSVKSTPTGGTVFKVILPLS